MPRFWVNLSCREERDREREKNKEKEEKEEEMEEKEGSERRGKKGKEGKILKRIEGSLCYIKVPWDCHSGVCPLIHGPLLYISSQPQSPVDTRDCPSLLQHKGTPRSKYSPVLQLHLPHSCLVWKPF